MITYTFNVKLGVSSKLPLTADQAERVLEVMLEDFPQRLSESTLHGPVEATVDVLEWENDSVFVEE